MSLGSGRLRDLAEEWYGEIAADWRIQRFKHLATIRNGQVDPEEPHYKNLPLFAPNHIESGTGRLLDVESADEQGAESGKYFVQQGEIVYSKIRPGLRKVTIAPTDGLCSADMYPIRPRKHVDSRFLLFAMLSEGFSRYALLESDRVAMPKINREALGECVFALPDRRQQGAIAKFLDRKTTAIDALIAKKERLIELLREKRQALITQAVTKGLNPNVPMKDSGIAWLGHIPAHWSALPLKRNWSIIDCKHRTVPFALEGIPLASIGEVQRFDVDLRNAKRTTREEYLQLIEGGRRPHRGDIIYSRNATVGAAAIVATDEEFAMGQDVCMIRSKAQNPRFLLNSLRSSVVLQQLDAVMVGATFKRINVSEIADLVVCYPPRAEQDQIAAYCDELRSRAEMTLALVSRHVDLLREYRQALISAAVTGKLDISAEDAT